MINKCPFFNLCGGCKFDFADDNYRQNKTKLLPKINFTEEPIWGDTVPLWLEGCPQGRGVAYKTLPQNSKLLQYAKELRKAGSLPEALLWKELKNKQINGLNFNRQTVIGDYIVDFFCPVKGVVIEIDDKTHDFKAEHDEKREKFLLSLGLTTIHVSAKEVLKDISSVVEFIKRHPGTSCHPSSQRGTCFGFQNKSEPPKRRRADFSFDNGHFGFFKKQSKDIVDINHCVNVVSEINDVLPKIAKIPWTGRGSVLITKCENGIDVVVNSDMPFFSADFKTAVDKLPANIIRFVWNDKVVRKYAEPEIKFNDKIINYPPNAFLQPTVETEQILRDLVVKYVDNAKKVADLFCGLGNFTFATHATGFDIVGNGIKRDLFKKPLNTTQLNQYDVVIMDPPRAGAEKQSKELSKSNVKRIIYVSCNPITFVRDKQILEKGNYKMLVAIPVDQFVGSAHWEIFSVFEK